jgi:hypothetical protein
MLPQKRPRKEVVATSFPNAEGHPESMRDDGAFNPGDHNDTQDSEETGNAQLAIPNLDEDEIPDYLQNAGSKSLPATPTSTTSRRGYVTAGRYNSLKSFNGQFYSGMAVGGSHAWNYNRGVWKETKEEPDLWKINNETKK